MGNSLIFKQHILWVSGKGLLDNFCDLFCRRIKNEFHIRIIIISYNELHAPGMLSIVWHLFHQRGKNKNSWIGIFLKLITNGFLSLVINPLCFKFQPERSGRDDLLYFNASWHKRADASEVRSCGARLIFPKWEELLNLTLTVVLQLRSALSITGASYFDAWQLYSQSLRVCFNSIFF